MRGTNLSGRPVGLEIIFRIIFKIILLWNFNKNFNNNFERSDPKNHGRRQGSLKCYLELVFRILWMHSVQKLETAASREIIRKLGKIIIKNIFKRQRIFSKRQRILLQFPPDRAQSENFCAKRIIRMATARNFKSNYK